MKASELRRRDLICFKYIQSRHGRSFPKDVAGYVDLVPRPDTKRQRIIIGPEICYESENPEQFSIYRTKSYLVNRIRNLRRIE